MKLLVILEFGVPPYRDFLFKFLNTLPEVDSFLVVHTGQKFKEWQFEYDTKKVKVFQIGRLVFHREIFALIKDYDVIVSSFNIYRPMCWLPMLFSKKPWILWGEGIGRHKKNFLNKFIRTPFIKKCSEFIVYTEQAKNDLINEWAIDKNKLSVANNTLYIANAEFIQAERHYFLYVGRVQERKGLDSVIYALKRLKDQGLKVPFFIVGDGIFKENLMSLTNELGVNDLVFFRDGTFDDEELKEYFKHALAYVSPKNVGLGVVHAFSYGIPVITSNYEQVGKESFYCSNENSFIYESEQKLELILQNLLEDSTESFNKGKAGYSFYQNSLSHKHMNKVFKDAILNVGQ